MLTHLFTPCGHPLGEGLPTMSSLTSPLPTPAETSESVRVVSAQPTATLLLNESQRAALEDELETERYTHWVKDAAGCRQGQSRFLLDGLYCAACAGVIEAAVMRVEGVQQADVNGAARRAVFTWDPTKTSPAHIVAAIHGVGYQAFPDTGANAVECHQAQSRVALWRLFVASFCMMQVMMYAAPAYFSTPGDLSPDLAQLLRWASWVLSIPVLLFSAAPFFSGAWNALKFRRIGMDVPVALGLVVTFVASTGATFDPSGPFGHEVYFDSFTMFVAFLLGGRYLETWARSRTAQSLDAVLRRLPDSVERVLADGETERVSVARLREGDRVRVAAGQAFVADGTVVVGVTQVDEAMLTGESRPVERGVGDTVVAGSINLMAPVEFEVDALGAQTHYHRIVTLMDRALNERPPLVRAADRIAGPFLWGVLVLALGSAWVWQWIDPSRAIWVAVSVLIVTCPCALSLAVPSVLLTASGVLARRGVLVQRLEALESLSKAQVVLFDKTGTLTEDQLHLVASHPVLKPEAVSKVTSETTTGDASLCRAVACGLARHSAHPLSKALVSALSDVSPIDLFDVQELPGRGMTGRDHLGREWWLGSLAWATAVTSSDGVVGATSAVVEQLSAWSSAPQIAVCLSNASGPQMVFQFDECLRADASDTLHQLRASGLRTELLSGDSESRVATIAQALGIVSWHAQFRPEDKLAAIAAAQTSGQTVLAVGDGLNDAPLLARADVSVAFGHGAALAQSRADIVLANGRLAGVAWAHSVALRAMQIVRQNLVWAIAYNVTCVPLAMAGWLAPWAAGLGMALSSLVVIVNALRLSRLHLEPR